VFTGDLKNVVGKNGFMINSANYLNNSDLEGNLKRLRAGAVLLARSELRDPNFEATVVLVCVFGQDGVYGLVLNRLVHMPISEIFDGFSGLNVKQKIHIGGPVQQDELQILQITELPMDGAYQIIPNVYVGGKWQSIGQIINEDKASTWLFLGYSGWDMEQLQTEIKAAAWDVYSVNICKLLSDLPQNITRSVKEIKEYLESISTN
jgi:putative transcriptional regulator